MSENKLILPVIPLRGMTILPGTTVHFDIGRKTSVKAAEHAVMTGKELFVVTQKDPVEETPGFDSIYKVGTVVTIKQLNKLPDNIVRVMVEAKSRGQILNIEDNEGYFQGEIDILEDVKDLTDIEEKALIRELQGAVKKLNDINNQLSAATMNTLMNIHSIDELIKQVLMRVKLTYAIKQEILEEDSVTMRFALLIAYLNDEIEIANVRKNISKKVNDNLNKLQKEHILREQMSAIRHELGDDFMSEAEELENKINFLNADKEVKEQLLKELSRLKNTMGNPSEGGVLRTYIDTMLEMPWNNKTEENSDLSYAAKVLDRDHYGLEKVKERVLEFLAVRVLTGAKGDTPIICLVGPPGTGKTSIAKSVSEALNKKYVRISLGGVDDEAEIRGHRKTYVGAMPGRIATGLKQAKTSNPLMLFDEIDKLGRNGRGDPAAALLEVMDSEQNCKFRDNYIEAPIDLSGVLFIATANDINAIPAPLLDRMEVIRIEGYTENEKFHIAKEHLVGKTFEKNGLKKSQLNITDDAIMAVIRNYTREAGVRQLERKISEICRKAAKTIVIEQKKKLKVSEKNIEKYLGRKKIEADMVNEKDDVGIVRGLAWTAVGGTTLQIEVNTMPGKGNLIITGQLGDVMKESAKIALSFVRSIAIDYGVDKKFFEENDIHIHVPEGAVPKDGPSAGITMATAILSAITGIMVKADVAMTGEINLRGNVMAIGGLKEKLLAAKNAGINTVLVPKKNEPDVEEISKEITEGLEIAFVEKMEQVLKFALVEWEQ